MKGLILLKNNFEDAEAIVTIDLIKRANILIDTVSCEDNLNVISKYGLEIKCSNHIDNLNLNDYSFLVIPGGSAVLNHLEDEKTFKIINHFEQKKQLIAAICAAPSLLGKLGLLDNEEFTCFPSFENYSKGTYLGNNVVVKNNHITSKACGTVFEFAYEIVKYLKDEDAADRVFKEIYYKN